jgi:anti-sigma regulatory factor (Ser/Thr protein kinase)
MNQAADRMPAAAGLRSSAVVEGELHLALNNTIAAVEDGRQELLRFLAPLALSDRVINRLEVVFEELVSNIVRHGFAPGSDQSIAVRVAARPGVIQLTFEDDGAPFDPLAAPPAARLTSLETARLGGLGLPLVRKMAAELAYEPIASGNRLTVSITTT